jgi:predicted nucleic acid-binding Zn ribbon protein
LLGIDHRHCPNCGAAQDPEWRYFPSDEDQKTITDPKYKYAGVDKTCPACGQPNSAAANFCKECGADLSNAQQVAVREAIAKGSAADTGKADDVTLKKFQEEQASIKKAEQKPSRLPLVLIGIAVVIVVIGVALFALSRSTYAASLSVKDATWERSITVEELQRESGGSWCDSRPGDAYNIITTSRTDTRPERYQCGTTTERRDRGDGSFSEVQVPKYCTRQVQYQRNWCDYNVNRWHTVNTLHTNGGPNDPLTWPNFTPRGSGGSVGDQRGTNKETLTVTFLGLGDKAGSTYTYNPPNEDAWRKFSKGQVYSVQINRLEMVQWDTLKLTQ